MKKLKMMTFVILISALLIALYMIIVDIVPNKNALIILYAFCLFLSFKELINIDKDKK